MRSAFADFHAKPAIIEAAAAEDALQFTNILNRLAVFLFAADFARADGEKYPVRP